MATAARQLAQKQQDVSTLHLTLKREWFDMIAGGVEN
jgi:hypothetical protein